MHPAVAMKLESNLVTKPAEITHSASARPTILVATADPEIQSGLVELLKGFLVDVLWVNGVTEAKRLLSSQKISACLCGFWLQDGTYRELVRHMRHDSRNISVIIVSPPQCPDEYRDYLAAMNIGALDFLCHPYQPFDFERMLESAINSQVRPIDESRAPERHEAIQAFPESGAA